MNRIIDIYSFQSNYSNTKFYVDISCDNDNIIECFGKYGLDIIEHIRNLCMILEKQSNILLSYKLALLFIDYFVCLMVWFVVTFRI